MIGVILTVTTEYEIMAVDVLMHREDFSMHAGTFSSGMVYTSEIELPSGVYPVRIKSAAGGVPLTKHTFSRSS